MIKEGDQFVSLNSGVEYTPQLTFEFAEVVDPQLSVCEICMKYKVKTITFVNSAPRPYNWNRACKDCLNRLINKIEDVCHL